VLRRLADPAARPLVARDLLELVRAAPGELHRHDRAPAAARARVEVRARPVELQVLARHLRDLGRLVLEEVVVGAIRDDAGALCAGADDGVLAAGNDDHRLRNREHLASLRALGCELVGCLFLVERPVDEPLRVLVEDVVRARRALRGLCLDAREQVVQRGELDRLPADRDGGPGKGRLEVVQLELRGLPDDVRSSLRIADTRQLDDDLVVALRPDLGLRHAEAVDAAPHDLDRAVEVLVGQVSVRRRNRLQRDLEAALQVEAERRLLAKRRAGDGKQRHADERSDQKPDDEEG
jgi:hypothetical protein